MNGFLEPEGHGLQIHKKADRNMFGHVTDGSVRPGNQADLAVGIELRAVVNVCRRQVREDFLPTALVLRLKIDQVLIAWLQTERRPPHKIRIGWLMKKFNHICALARQDRQAEQLVLEHHHLEAFKGQVVRQATAKITSGHG